MRGVTRFCVYSFMLCVLVSFQAMRLQAASLTVGDSVYLGCYEQNDKSESREAIEWIVLEVQDEKALLISKLGLEYMKFDEDADSSWVSSTLRSWLNQEFYDSAFSDEEKEAILLTVVPNDPSQGRLREVVVLHGFRRVQLSEESFIRTNTDSLMERRSVRISR